MWDNIQASLNYIMGLVDFHSNYKILIAVHYKHPNFWPSADPVHAMPWQCMFALSLCTP
jgi:hypothetical protein